MRQDGAAALAPSNIPDEEKRSKKESDEDRKKKSRDKFWACMFMDGANKTRYGKCIADLSNSYLSRMISIQRLWQQH